jgi:hypothetical protein
MNPEVLELIIKGVSAIPAMIEAGISVVQRIEQIKALAQGAKDGTITDAYIAKIRAQFDADLDDFNTPM